MALQRAIVKGTLFDTVQVRNMYVASVTESGGDTSEVLWTAYLDSIYDEITAIQVPGMEFTSYELQVPDGDQWATIAEVAFAHVGTFNGNALPNAVAAVILGKASGVRHVGRKFFSGIADLFQDENALIGDALVHIAATLLAYITPFTGIGGGLIQPGIITKAGTFSPFVGGFVSSLLGSCRRRKPGLGI